MPHLKGCSGFVLTVLVIVLGQIIDRINIVPEIIVI